MSKEFLAKPKGTTLKEHTENVVNEAKSVIQAHSFVLQKYIELTEKSLEKRLLASAWYHDDGKKHIKWQEACWKEYEEYLKTGKVNGSFMQKTGLRHEMESLKLHKNDKNQFSEVLKVAIAAHHGKLGKRFEERWEKDENGVYKEFWDEIEQISLELIFAKMQASDKLKATVLKNYEFAGVRSYLQLSDHRASIKEDNKSIPNFTPFDYQFNPEWQKRPVQEIAEENWQDELLLLRAPTGAGKTDACLLWAKKQIENGKADRLIIAMPTRFTSNALAINVSTSLSETGLYHSSAWFVRHFENAKQSNAAEHEAKLQHEFARLLETPVTVCTIDHLLIALTHTREDHHSIIFNLAHSCLVIDEADFYDEFTQANILELLKVLRILKVPVMLMSASLPQSSLRMYQSTGFQPQEIKEDTSDNQRMRCTINRITNYEKVNELNDILEIATKEPTIIYANTVAKAMEFYKWFTDSGIKPLLYHSRFTEPHKAQKENILLDNLGKESWKEGKANGVAILTQIGEMSVNISANYMISDICPMDRLVQRIGRLARFDETIGKLEVLIPYKHAKIYPAPYGNYIMKQGWEMSKYFDKTIKLLECKQYNAFEFVNLINEIYKELELFSNLTQLNADKLKEQIIQNWLIVPMAETKEDSDCTHVWKSRNIENQVDIFVLDPYDYLEKKPQRFSNLNKHKDKACFFDNYKEFMFYKNQYSIASPQYLFQKGKKTGKVYQREKIWIADNREPQSIWCTNSYSDELGLILDDTDNFGEIS
jgi:CRISPR-associated endonuclease/helicase Cas3